MANFPTREAKGADAKDFGLSPLKVGAATCIRSRKTCGWGRICRRFSRASVTSVPAVPTATRNPARHGPPASRRASARTGDWRTGAERVSCFVRCASRDRPSTPLSLHVQETRRRQPERADSGPCAVRVRHAVGPRRRWARPWPPLRSQTLAEQIIYFYVVDADGAAGGRGPHPTNC